MPVLDVHTHGVSYSADRVCNIIFGRETLPPESGCFSVGMHPWYLPAHWQEQLDAMADLLEKRPDVVALGECGLDRLSEVSWQQQMAVLEAQCELAERLRLPVILHVVKAHSEILALHRRMAPATPWIIHGFRGRPELALQYVSAGFYLSFGYRYHTESPSVVPLSRLLLETDESRVPVEEVARSVALACRIPLDTLIEQVVSNTDKLFFSHRSCLLG